MSELQKILKEFAEKIRYKIPLFSDRRTDKEINKLIKQTEQKIKKLIRSWDV